MVLNGNQPRSPAALYYKTNPIPTEEKERETGVQRLARWERSVCPCNHKTNPIPTGATEETACPLPLGGARWMTLERNRPVSSFFAKRTQFPLTANFCQELPLRRAASASRANMNWYAQ